VCHEREVVGCRLKKVHEVWYSIELPEMCVRRDMSESFEIDGKTLGEVIVKVESRQPTHLR
jgi:hypothetical protein